MPARSLCAICISARQCPVIMRHKNKIYKREKGYVVVIPSFSENP